MPSGFDNVTWTMPLSIVTCTSLSTLERGAEEETDTEREGGKYIPDVLLQRAAHPVAAC